MDLQPFRAKNALGECVPLPSERRERPFCDMLSLSLFASFPQSKDSFPPPPPDPAIPSWSCGHTRNSLLHVLCPHLQANQVSPRFKFYASLINTVWSHLYKWNLKKVNSEKQRVEQWLPGAAVGGGGQEGRPGEMLVKASQEFSCVRWKVLGI